MPPPRPRRPLLPAPNPAPIPPRVPLLVLLTTLGLSLSSPEALAQTYVLRNGQQIRAADVTLGDGALVQTSQTASGELIERRFPLSEVVRLNFPEPEAFEVAERLIAAGQGAQAFEAITPVYRQFAPFSRLPGSFWARAAEVRLRALLLTPDRDAITSAARELMQRQSELGPEISGTAKLALAQLDVRAGNEALATAMLDEIEREAVPAVRARAWLLRGDLASLRASHVEALEAYLRIPAFFGTFDELMPAALLGSALAYRAYGDTGRAERSALDLIDTYPDSAEAKRARVEFGF